MRENKEPFEAELWIGGDVHLGTAAVPVLRPLAEILKGAAGIVNLEGPVAETAPSKPGLNLINSPVAIKYLREAGVSVLEIDNNHSLDAGPTGPFNTAKALRRAGLQPAGNLAGPAVLNIQGIRIAVAAYDLTLGVPKDLAASLAAARAKADFLVVGFHVTGPESYLPQPELRRAVAIALKAGAKVVAAHGTHMIGPVERRGNSIVAWGLGNLAFACDCTKEREGLLIRLRISSNGAIEARVIPIQAGLQGEPAKLSPDAQGVFNLLAAIGSSKLDRHGLEADF